MFKCALLAAASLSLVTTTVSAQGMVSPPTISGAVFYDVNENGVFDPLVPGEEGIVVSEARCDVDGVGAFCEMPRRDCRGGDARDRRPDVGQRSARPWPPADRADSPRDSVLPEPQGNGDELNGLPHRNAADRATDG